MSSAKRKLVISRPPMLTVPSCYSSDSYMILYRKILMRVGERRHPCRSLTVVRNQSHVLPLNCTLGLVLQILNDSYDVGIEIS